MKLTILGSGTGVPSGERNSSGYFVDSVGARIMMDCGAGTLHALARYRLPWERMTHLYVSHFHVDHIGELASLFFAFRHGMKEKRSDPLTIIGPAGLDRVMSGLESAFGANLFDPKFPVHLKTVSAGERVELAGDVALSVVKTPHTDESLAVRIESGNRALCYTGDTASSDEVADFFRGASLLVSECSFRERREDVPHLSVKDVAKMARRAGAEKLVVTHSYFDVNEAELREAFERDYSGEVVIGRDGLSLDV